MWIFVLYDLPTHTKPQMKAAARFRKRLLEAGFQMGQYSVYLRVRPTRGAYRGPKRSNSPRDPRSWYGIDSRDHR